MAARSRSRPNQARTVQPPAASSRPGVGDAAEGGGHGLPRLLALLVQQRVEEALAELGRRPDGEDEPAVDGMAVGRDDPPGDDVGAVREAVVEVRRPPGGRRCPPAAVAAVHAVPPAVEHAHATEGDRHRLGELEGHRGGRFGDGLAVAGGGRQQLRVGSGRRCTGERKDQDETEGGEEPASRGVRLAPGGPWEEGAGARRRPGEEPDHGEAGEVEDVVGLPGERAARPLATSSSAVPTITAARATAKGSRPAARRGAQVTSSQAMASAASQDPARGRGARWCRPRRRGRGRAAR